MVNEIRKYINILNEAEEKVKLLNEAMMNVEDDVDLLYNLFFKKYVDEIKQTGSVSGLMDRLEYNRTDTSILKNDLCVKANELNPCKLIFHDYENKLSNHYNPSMHIIQIKFNDSAIEFINDEHSGSIQSALYDYPKIRYEFTEYRIKGTINHELMHWLDDTFHGNYITKRGKSRIKRYEMGKKDKWDWFYLPSHEINAVIYNIKQLYNKYKDDWDNMYFSDVVKLIPTIQSATVKLSKSDLELYYRKLKTRMYREGLLGKNMKYD